MLQGHKALLLSILQQLKVPYTFLTSQTTTAAYNVYLLEIKTPPGSSSLLKRLQRYTIEYMTDSFLELLNLLFGVLYSIKQWFKGI